MSHSLGLNTSSSQLFHSWALKAPWSFYKIFLQPSISIATLVTCFYNSCAWVYWLFPVFANTIRIHTRKNRIRLTRIKVLPIRMKLSGIKYSSFGFRSNWNTQIHSMCFVGSKVMAFSAGGKQIITSFKFNAHQMAQLRIQIIWFKRSLLAWANISNKSSTCSVVFFKQMTHFLHCC